MDIASLTALFGWMTVINRVTGLEENALKPVYLYFLGFYKVLIILFNLAPYLALKLI